MIQEDLLRPKPVRHLLSSSCRQTCSVDGGEGSGTIDIELAIQQGTDDVEEGHADAEVGSEVGFAKV
jgi:hypothetical protein